ncbi:S8 family serine peptidase [Tenacibaculum sp. 190524A02b]|uniref:S8 family serine peptidase n=1 Tax=Tenacibaculum vairaonense TaxID=3137860 RepID=UPI0031FB6FB3
MKNQLKQVLTSIIFCVMGTVIAQKQQFNNKNQQKGVVIVKFKPFQEKQLRKQLIKTNQNRVLTASKKIGYVTTGSKSLDAKNKELKVFSMKRVFRPAGKHEAKHKKFGLHLWYEITYNNHESVDKAIELYKRDKGIEVAHARYKVDKNRNNNTFQEVPIKPLNKHNKINNNFTGIPNDPDFDKQWHYKNTGQEDGTIGSDINLEEAWKIEKGDSRVIVAVMDEEVEPSHPDLKRNMWVNEGEIPGNEIDDDNNGYVDDIHGYNFVWDRGELKGEDHGTHVAGTIAADTNNGIGVAGVAGGTGKGDGVRIMSCAILSWGIGGLEESYVYAADNGAVISNNSWGLHVDSSQDKVTATKAGIDYFVANAGGKEQAMEGGLVIFAAGNDNNEYSDSFPDAYEPVFHVASTDNKDKKSSFSTYGSWVEIAAPGSKILSTLPDGKYGYNSGTSMATPHVAGVAALIVSKNYGNITSNQVKSLLQGGSKQIDNLNPSFVGKLGAGRLDAYASLLADVNNIPINMTSDTKTETSIKIDWSSVIEANSYELRYKAIGELNWKSILVNTNSTVINNLKKTTEYQVQVRAKGNFGTSVFSERKVFWTSNNNPLPPNNVSPFARRLKSAGLKWDEVDDATAYEVSYKKSTDANWIIFIPRSKNRAKLNGLTEQTEYQIRVRSIYGNTYSEYSDELVFFTGTPVCSDFDPWDPNTTYPGTDFWTEGSIVSHKGFIYENKHWTQNQEPGVSSAWKKLEACSGSGNNTPKVSIISLSNQQVIIQSSFEAITLSANATDSDGTIDKIQFSVNNTNLTQGNNIDWIPTAYGAYTIKVEVTDNQGATAVDIITITVKEEKGNQPPELTMVTPVNGQIFEQDVFKPIALKVNATDSDGTIESIQFSVNNINLEKGNDKEWIPESYGDYIIKVIVTDDKQAITSKQITIIIKQPVTNEGCEGIAVWDVAKEYKVAGLQVVHKKNIYESKWWTKNEEPGTGGSWGPWKLIRACSEVQNFIVSPNPVQSRLKLKANILPKMNIQVSVSTLTGELIKEEVLKAESNSLSFDVSSLQKGIYVLKIKTQQYTQTQKILIE